MGASRRRVTPESGHIESTHGGRIAYVRTPGSAPGTVFVGGFMSDMTGTKATALEAWAQAGDRAFVRFDYRGHGASDGAFEDGTIGAWLADALQIIDSVSEGPQILVGSSMGGWIALLAALARPDRVAAVFGIAAAPDFTRRMWTDELDDAEREAVKRDGRVTLPSEYSSDGYIITERLIDEAERHCLLDAPIPLRCPVRLHHGLQDAVVPVDVALRIAERVESDDVRVHFPTEGDHRLSEPEDLARMTATLDELAALVAEGETRPQSAG